VRRYFVALVLAIPTLMLALSGCGKSADEMNPKVKEKAPELKRQTPGGAPGGTPDGGAPKGGTAKPI
jgi:hypothetical protein